MTADYPGLPRFGPDATLVMDTPNGTEVWTGAHWNQYAERAERNMEIVPVRFLLVDYGDEGVAR